MFSQYHHDAGSPRQAYAAFKDGGHGLPLASGLFASFAVCRWAFIGLSD